MNATFHVMSDEQFSELMKKLDAVLSLASNPVKDEVTDEVLTTDDLMKLLKKSRTTIWIYQTQKGMPFHSDGNGARFYLKSEIMNWLKEIGSQDVRC